MLKLKRNLRDVRFYVYVTLITCIVHFNVNEYLTRRNRQFFIIREFFVCNRSFKLIDF